MRQSLSNRVWKFKYLS